METKNINKKAQHLINCDVDPFIPVPKSPAGRWYVISHIKNGIITWNPDNISLYLSEQQKNGFIIGNDLIKNLEDKPVLNANVLDYLLYNTDIIPKEWGRRHINFWGTIYHYSFGGKGEPCVRCLCVDYPGARPSWRFSYLGGKFSSIDYSAIFK